MSLRSFFLSVFLRAILPCSTAFFSTALFSTLLCSTARAQMGFGGGVALRGEIENDPTATAGEKYVIVVSECGDGGDLGRTTLGFDNKFEFRDLKAGCKVVRILSFDERRLLHEERVLAQSDNVPVVIHMGAGKKNGAERSLPAGSAPTVSADGLRHPIPPKVLRALSETQRLTEAGHMEEAESKLQDVVKHNPNVWQAQLNLGAVQMKLGRPVEALASFDKAREIEPHSSMAAMDSAIALVVLRRIREAEGAAQQALTLDPSNQSAKALLDRLRAARERGLIKDAPEN